VVLKFGLLFALSSITAAAHAETPVDLAHRYGLAGEILISKGDRIVLHEAYGSIVPSGGAQHRVGERWRMASITKQVAAALLINEIDLATLDQPIAPKGPTRRQLLTHHSGLANPDETPTNGSGVPAFYTRFTPDLRYCASKAPQPGAPFQYNNCDYLSLPTTSRGWRWPAGLTMAKPGEVGVPGFVKGRPEPQFQLASWGAAGGLIGTVRSLFAFDRSLMTGKLVPRAKLAELWKPEGNGSYQALGQWVFPGKLKGCAETKRIVQRDGEIFGVQARNYIFPDDDLVVIVFTNRSADDFAFGEVWQQSGFAYDLLSSAACR
jgi:CubicO group peptidase (beta-lactamase class C family)